LMGFEASHHVFSEVLVSLLNIFHELGALR
jgi:hypothetical protein